MDIIKGDHTTDNVILVKFDYNDNDLGRFNFDTIDITINPKVIRDEDWKYGTDFYTLLMHVINHEYLHYVLIMDHGYEACMTLDKLIHNRQTEEKNWNYWLS